MEMSVSALWGNAPRAELFDAWPLRGASSRTVELRSGDRKQGDVL